MSTYYLNMPAECPVCGASITNADKHGPHGTQAAMRDTVYVALCLSGEEALVAHVLGCNHCPTTPRGTP